MWFHLLMLALLVGTIAFITLFGAH